MSALEDFLRTGPGRAAAAAALAIGVSLAPAGAAAAAAPSFRMLAPMPGEGDGPDLSEAAPEEILAGLAELREEMAAEVEACAMVGEFLDEHVRNIAAVAGDARVPARHRLAAMADLAGQALSDMSDLADLVQSEPSEDGGFDPESASGNWVDASMAGTARRSARIPGGPDPELVGAALAARVESLLAEVEVLDTGRRSCVDRLDGLVDALADAATAEPADRDDLDRAIVEALGRNVAAHAPAP